MPRPPTLEERWAQEPPLGMLPDGTLNIVDENDPPTLSVMSDNSQFLHSSLREKVLEHLFVGDLLRCLWRLGRRDIELLRAEVDYAGYDLVLECNGCVRHVQLKSSHRNAAVRTVNAHVGLTKKPSACIIWIRFNSTTMELGPFLWFGAEPGCPVPPLGATGKTRSS